MTPDSAAALRARLLALHRDALAQLAAAEVIDSGLLRLVADSSAVLAVLDQPTMVDAEREPAA